MSIEFTGPAIPAPDGGVAYRILVDGSTISCRITLEALQDIDPANNQNDQMAQFQTHSSRLLSITESKIRNGEIENNVVWVRTADV